MLLRRGPRSGNVRPKPRAPLPSPQRWASWPGLLSEPVAHGLIGGFGPIADVLQLLLVDDAAILEAPATGAPVAQLPPAIVDLNEQGDGAARTPGQTSETQRQAGEGIAQQLRGQQPRIAGRHLLILACHLGGSLIEQPAPPHLDGGRELGAIALVKHRAVEGEEAIAELNGADVVGHHLPHGLKSLVGPTDGHALVACPLLFLAVHRQLGGDPVASAQQGGAGIEFAGQVQQGQTDER